MCNELIRVLNCNTSSIFFRSRMAHAPQKLRVSLRGSRGCVSPALAEKVRKALSGSVPSVSAKPGSSLPGSSRSAPSEPPHRGSDHTPWRARAGASSSSGATADAGVARIAQRLSAQKASQERSGAGNAAAARQFCCADAPSRLEFAELIKEQGIIDHVLF